MVKEDRSDIVQMTVQREDASPCLVRPNFDLVVVSAGHKERLGFVEVDAANGPIMLFKSINECAHAVIP